MLIFTFFVLFLVFIHDLTMTEHGNNSIIEKRVLLMFLVAVQVTGKAKKFIYKDLLDDTLELLLIIITQPLRCLSMLYLGTSRVLFPYTKHRTIISVSYRGKTISVPFLYSISYYYKQVMRGNDIKVGYGLIISQLILTDINYEY